MLINTSSNTWPRTATYPLPIPWDSSPKCSALSLSVLLLMTLESSTLGKPMQTTVLTPCANSTQSRLTGQALNTVALPSLLGTMSLVPVMSPCLAPLPRHSYVSSILHPCASNTAPMPDRRRHTVPPHNSRQRPMTLRSLIRPVSLESKKS